MRLLISLCFLVGLSFATFDMVKMGDQHTVSKAEDVIVVPSPPQNKSKETKSKDTKDMYYDIAANTDRSVEERARAISEKYAQIQQPCGMILAMAMVAQFENHEDEFKKRFRDKWKPALREFVKRTRNGEEKEEKQIIAELQVEIRSPWGLRTTKFDSKSEMSDAMLDIAQDSERDLIERTMAITEKYTEQQKAGGYLLGVTLSIRYDSHVGEFKELFGDNWKPALREYFRRAQGPLFDEVESREKKRIIVELGKEWPLREGTFIAGRDPAATVEDTSFSRAIRYISFVDEMKTWG